MKAVINDASSITLRPNDDLRVTRHRSVAWTTVTFHVAVQMKAGDIFETDGRHTAIWEKRGDQWLIVHEHMSAPLPG